MDKEQAQTLVKKELENSQNQYDPIELVILESKTIEREWGWVFFYQSKKYLETGNISHLLNSLRCAAAPAV